MSGIEEKIERAGRMSDDNPQNDDILMSWSRELEHIRITEEFVKFPETIRMKELGFAAVASINQRLLNDETLSKEDRLALLYSRKVHNIYLNILNVDPKKDKKALEAEVDGSLQHMGG